MKSRSSVISCIRELLKPVVRFALTRAIKIQDLEEAVKQVYLELAADSLSRDGSAVSTSKLAVMTGIHRRDVDRLFKRPEEAKYGSDLLSRIIGQWQADKRYSSKGRARTLEVEGKESEFVELVSSVSKNLNPYTVLSELERIGVVERMGTKIKLTASALQISGDEVEAFSLAAKDAHDLLAAVEENLAGKDDLKNLHIRTEYDNLAIDSLGDIRRWFMEKGRELHSQARAFLSKYDLDINQSLRGKKGGGKASLCAFSLVVDSDGHEKGKVERTGDKK